MADPKHPPIAPDPGQPHGSFEDTGQGIGQNADGTFNIFPLSELPARLAQREQEIKDAESEDDLSDLDDVVDAITDEKA